MKEKSSMLLKKEGKREKQGGSYWLDLGASTSQALHTSNRQHKEGTAHGPPSMLA